jgi:hypothetical protein
MSVSYVFLLAKWGSAGSKRFARFECEGIPIQFACTIRILNILAVVILQVILIVIFFRIPI